MSDGHQSLPPLRKSSVGELTFPAVKLARKSRRTKVVAHVNVAAGNLPAYSNKIFENSARWTSCTRSKAADRVEQPAARNQRTQTPNCWVLPERCACAVARGAFVLLEKEKEKLKELCSRGRRTMGSSRVQSDKESSSPRPSHLDVLSELEHRQGISIPSGTQRVRSRSDTFAVAISNSLCVVLCLVYGYPMICLPMLVWQSSVCFF